MRRLKVRGLFLLSAFVCFLFLSSVQATPTSIVYGDKLGATIDYLQVTEDSGTDSLSLPLYGDPTVYGDAIVFSPTAAFSSYSSGAGGTDITDGKLTITISAHAGQYIDTIIISEFGDYTLTGTGTSATNASVGARLNLTVVAIDGVSNFIPQTTSANLIFTPSSGDYNLIDDGAGNAVGWSGSISVDVGGWLTSIGMTGNATELLFSMDNTLTTNSEVNTSSYIGKKGVNGIGITVVPEPTTIALLGFGAFGLLKKRKA